MNNDGLITAIAIPRIGTSCGGLNWEDARKVIINVFDDWAGVLFVYEGAPLI